MVAVVVHTERGTKISKEKHLQVIILQCCPGGNMQGLAQQLLGQPRASCPAPAAPLWGHGQGRPHPLTQPHVRKREKLVVTASTGFTLLSLVINVRNLDLWLKPCPGKGQYRGGHYCHNKGSPANPESSASNIDECPLLPWWMPQICHTWAPSSTPFQSLEVVHLSAAQTLLPLTLIEN